MVGHPGVCNAGYSVCKDAIMPDCSMKRNVMKIPEHRFLAKGKAYEKNKERKCGTLQLERSM